MMTLLIPLVIGFVVGVFSGVLIALAIDRGLNMDWDK